MARAGKAARARARALAEAFRRAPTSSDPARLARARLAARAPALRPHLEADLGALLEGLPAAGPPRGHIDPPAGG